MKIPHKLPKQEGRRWTILSSAFLSILFGFLCDAWMAGCMIAVGLLFALIIDILVADVFSDKYS